MSLVLSMSEAPSTVQELCIALLNKCLNDILYEYICCTNKMNVPMVTSILLTYYMNNYEETMGSDPPSPKSINYIILNNGQRSAYTQCSTVTTEHCSQGESVGLFSPSSSNWITANSRFSCLRHSIQICLGNSRRMHRKCLW